MWYIADERIIAIPEGDSDRIESGMALHRHTVKISNTTAFYNKDSKKYTSTRITANIL